MSERPTAEWLVIADQLSSENHPLGEYIVLALKYENGPVPALKKRRLRKLARTVEGLFAPGVTFVSWYRSGLTLNFQDAESVLFQAAELRRLKVPLFIEVGDSSRSVECCYFDADFAHLAWMESSYTVENQNFSPGMDETYTHYRTVKVWRVADRSVLLERTFRTEWSELEFRQDGLYALEGSRAERIDFPSPSGRGSG